MVTAAILKIPKLYFNSAHASEHFCKVSLSLVHFHFFVVSMVTVAILKIPKTDSTLNHYMLPPHKVSMGLISYSLRKSRFNIFSHRANVKLSPCFHDNDGHFGISKYSRYIRAYQGTFP